MKKEVIVEYEDLGFAHVIGKTVQELIRCRDCEYKNAYGYCTLYTNWHHLTADQDFCSDAVRREDDSY